MLLFMICCTYQVKEVLDMRYADEEKTLCSVIKMVNLHNYYALNTAFPEALYTAGQEYIA